MRNIELLSSSPDPVTVMEGMPTEAWPVMGVMEAMVGTGKIQTLTGALHWPALPALTSLVISRVKEPPLGLPRSSDDRSWLAAQTMVLAVAVAVVTMLPPNLRIVVVFGKSTIKSERRETFEEERHR